METSCSLHPHVIPAIAQLVEHLTVDCAEIRWSLARFRVAGLLSSHPPTPFKGNVSVCGAVGPCILPVCTPMFQCAVLSGLVSCLSVPLSAERPGRAVLWKMRGGMI